MRKLTDFRCTFVVKNNTHRHQVYERGAMFSIAKYDVGYMDTLRQEKGWGVLHTRQHILQSKLHITPLGPSLYLRSPWQLALPHITREDVCSQHHLVVGFVSFCALLALKKHKATCLTAGWYYILLSYCFNNPRLCPSDNEMGMSHTTPTFCLQLFFYFFIKKYCVVQFLHLQFNHSVWFNYSVNAISSLRFCSDKTQSVELLNFTAVRYGCHLAAKSCKYIE